MAVKTGVEKSYLEFYALLWLLLILQDNNTCENFKEKPHVIP